MCYSDGCLDYSQNRIMSSRRSFSQWLLERAQKDRANLRLFVYGAALFFGGLGLALFAERQFVPSLTQEILALSGLILAAFGATMSILGYIALAILRFIQLVKKDD